jgi:hypothetical protein
MKKIFFLALLIIGVLVQPSNGQSVSINIGVQPVWGPVGYDHADYYYLPDIDGYYDVPSRMFVYLDGGVWVRRPALPPRYANFDLYHGYKVVINEPQPWLHHTVYHEKYAGFRERHDQVVIRDSRELKYYEVKEHPMHNQWHGDGHYDKHHDEHHEGHHEGEHEGHHEGEHEGHHEGDHH